jgi:hypothetical protein
VRARPLSLYLSSRTKWQCTLQLRGQIPWAPLPAVRDFTRDGRWSTYDVSVLKKMGGGRCAQPGHPLKLPSPTKLARLGHFPPASQAGRLAGPVFYVYVFSLADTLPVFHLYHRVHRVETADFQRSFNHGWKNQPWPVRGGGGARPPPFTLFAITNTKLQCTLQRLQLRWQIRSQNFYSTPMCTS